MTYTDEEYEQMAIKVIIDYKNKNYTDDEVRTLYPLGIKLVIDNIKKSLTVDQNIKSETQGPRSRTYKDDYVLVDNTIKTVLGLPYVRMY